MSIKPFPNLTRADIYQYRDKADVGDISSLDVFRGLGFVGDIGITEKSYLNTIETNEDLYNFAKNLKSQYRLALLSNDSSEWSKFLRDKYGLNDYFDAITISGDAKVKKLNL